MFNKYGYNYLIINSTPRGTEVKNVVFSRPNYVQQEFLFFSFLLQSLGYFQTTEKLRLKKVNSYLKRGPALAKATVFPVHQFCESKYHTDSLFTSSTKGVHFLSPAPHPAILKWCMLQKGLNYSFLKGNALIALLFLEQNKMPCVTVLVTKLWHVQL